MSCGQKEPANQEKPRKKQRQKEAKCAVPRAAKELERPRGNLVCQRVLQRDDSHDRASRTVARLYGMQRVVRSAQTMKALNAVTFGLSMLTFTSSIFMALATPLDERYVMLLVWATFLFLVEYNRGYMRRMTERRELLELARSQFAAFACPDCGMISYNRHDAAYRYCGNCHEYKESEK